MLMVGMTINHASINEQKRNGIAGKFGAKTTSAPTGSLTAVAPGRVRVGENLERISAAEARRRLPVGTKVQVAYFGSDRESEVRTVTKQSSHQMVSTRADGHGVYLGWGGTKADVDSAGSLVMTGEDGMPFVAFIPTSASEPEDVDVVTPWQVQDTLDARNPDTSAEDLMGIAERGVLSAAKRVSQNPSASSGVLAKVAETDDERVNSNILHNPNVNADVMRVLGRSQHRQTRSVVAMRDETPSDVLEILARDEDAFVRSRAIAHPSTPVELVEEASHSSDVDVREGAASNPRLSAESLDRLSRGHGFVMVSVAENPSASKETLSRLAADTSMGNQLPAMVASNPSTPTDVLAGLVSSEDKWIREHAARNPALSEAQASALATDSESRVRRRLGESSTSRDILNSLASDSDSFVQSSVAQNPNVSRDILQRLADGSGTGATVAKRRLEQQG